ncbi:hypothetical protein XAP6164_1750011 [Xanthomonas phaseoli pv. phaseoli]|nr:hypothetical protein XAP6164_1750011 [Xanthomonas phaseoli pv. phaseoli]
MRLHVDGWTRGTTRPAPRRSPQNAPPASTRLAGDADGRFDIACGHRAKKLLGQLAIRADQVGHRQAARGSEVLWRLVRVEDRDGVRHRVVLQERLHVGAGDVFVGQTHHLDGVAHGVQRRQFGHFLQARRAPGGPEIHHHPFAAVRGQVVGLAGYGRQRELGHLGGLLHHRAVGRCSRVGRRGGRGRRLGRGGRRSAVAGSGSGLAGRLAGGQQQQWQ